MTRPKVLRGALAAGLFAGSMLASAPGHASPTFPPALQHILDMPCPPPCTLCHRDSNGGIGTAVQSFGKAMKDHGLKAKRTDLIGLAVGKIENESVDSDADGVTDTDELRDGRNPNQAGEGFLCATYGCGARVAPEPREKDDGTFAWVSCVLALVLLRARRTI